MVDRSRIDSLFSVDVRVHSRCPFCGRDHNQTDREHGLCLTLSNHSDGKSLVDYLEDHFNGEIQTGYRCPSKRCGRIAAERKLTKRMFTAPQVLVIQLSRFEYSPLLQQVVKIHDRVDFEEELDLTAWTRSGVPLSYQLQGVVAHAGESATSGHYVAAVRERAGDRFSVISDQIVGQWRGGSFEEMKRPRTEETSFDPYLLVYNKLE